MKLAVSVLVVGLLAISAVALGEQQRILRRVIKSTPTATNLGRIRLVTVRSASAAQPETGAVTEISSKEATNFGQRSANETTQSASSTKTKQAAAAATTTTAATSSSTTTTTTLPTTTSSSTTTAASTTAAAAAATAATQPSAAARKQAQQHKASDRQQQAPQSEVEVLASAPSSWPMMAAVEAPAAMLIATGTRAAMSDLSSAASAEHESVSGNDVLRSSATKGSYSASGETFSRIRQQQQQQQQGKSFFYPQQQQQRASGKTSAAKGQQWYAPSTTARPAPIVQQRYEQQNDAYVEQQQQQQIEYASAPLGQAEPFAFDFKTEDQSGNGQYRKEESDKNGVVRGSYGYMDASGIYRHVEYVADQNGFRANIKSNEPGLQAGETQPASIQLASGGAAPSSRLSANNGDNNGEWNGNISEEGSAPAATNVAVAPPDFESAHKSERIRAPRSHYRF